MTNNITTLAYERFSFITRYLLKFIAEKVETYFGSANEDNLHSHCFRKSMACFGQVLACVLLSGSAVHGGLTPQISDNFDDNTTDSTLWTTITTGTGPSIQEANGRLEIKIPGNSTPGQIVDPKVGGMASAAGYYTKNFYTGNFDARVDFALQTWPNANGVRVGLSIGSYWQSLMRLSVAYQGDGRDAYAMSLWPGLAILDTTDLSGTLRIVRMGDLVTGYYLDSTGGNWIVIGSSIYPTGDKSFILSAWTDDSLFLKQDVQVSFDNFSVIPIATSPGDTIAPVPEPSTYLAGALLLLPFAANTIRKFRKNRNA